MTACARNGAPLRLERFEIDFGFRHRLVRPTFQRRLKIAPRAAQIDYDRQMALVAFDSDGRIHGVVRTDADPDNERAEVTLAADEPPGEELARLLLARIVSHARRRGTGSLFAASETPSSRLAALWQEAGGSSAGPSSPAGGQQLLLQLRPSGAAPWRA